MEYALTQLAEAAEPAKTDLFSSIGIDWKLLVLQSIAFLLLLFILKKWVYPPILAMLAKRDKQVAEAAKAAHEAKQQADEAKAGAEQVMMEAHKEAALIVSTAKQEAIDLSDASDKKARKRAERIVADAHEQTVRDLAEAKQQLKDEMLDLVAAATEKVTAGVVDAEADKTIIAKSLKDAA